MSRRRTDSPAAAGSTAAKKPGAGAANLHGYEILVCVTGGIAAYKTAFLVSQLVQNGAGVTVAMTRSARRFVGRTTFQGLTGRPVGTSLWTGGGLGEINHLRLSETADLCIVAPATANCLGKLAGGLADDLVSSLLLGCDCPVLLAPAMNVRMWQHPAVQRNVGFLKSSGFELVGPDDGWQACRAVGPGRMSEPDVIFAAAVRRLKSTKPRAAALR